MTLKKPIAGAAEGQGSQQAGAASSPTLGPPADSALIVGILPQPGLVVAGSNG